MSNAKRRHRRRRRYEQTLVGFATAVVRAYWKDPFSPWDVEKCRRLVWSRGRQR